MVMRATTTRPPARASEKAVVRSTARRATVSEHFRARRGAPGRPVHRIAESFRASVSRDARTGLRLCVAGEEVAPAATTPRCAGGSEASPGPVAERAAPTR